MWEVTSRVVVYAAIGAVLYGLLLVIQVPLPGTKNVSLRPAFGLVAFFGYAFGPIVGFFTGTVGNAIGDQISGWGALTSWNWSLANGFVGLIAGLAPLYLGSPDERHAGPEGPRRRHRRRGRHARRLHLHLDGHGPRRLRLQHRADHGVPPGHHRPTSSSTAIVVPILVFIWEPIKERMGR